MTPQASTDEQTRKNEMRNVLDFLLVATVDHEAIAVGGKKPKPKDHWIAWAFWYYWLTCQGRGGAPKTEDEAWEAFRGIMLAVNHNLAFSKIVTKGDLIKRFGVSDACG